MNGLRIVLLYVMVAILVFFSSTSAVGQALQPVGWDDESQPVVSHDTNNDPRVVEIELEARVSPVEIVPGVPSRVWTYNGGFPGPLIRARVGDRLIVHFSNKLPEATTVHWHGVQVPIEMDGVPGISQPPVEPGGSFTYDFVVPDAGLFWYHPHVMSAAQVGFGLYGALLVEERDEAGFTADELVLVLSDIAIDDASGEMHPPDSGGVAGTLFGREGNHVLVNGRQLPTLTVRDGALQRWRIVNSAKSRYFNLVLGDSQPFTLIGVDGGVLEYPLTRDHLLLAPGERMDVLVAPRFQKGQPLVLSTVPFNRGFGSIEFRTVDDLITFSRASLPTMPAAPMPRLARTIQPLSAASATPIRLDLVLNKGRGEFEIKGGPFWKGTAVRADVGETQLWTITNRAVWAHPIHLHGFFFQVVDENGIPERPLAWKDTVSVPADATVRFLVRFDRPGSWMYHCHILDHAEAGLMSTVDVGAISATQPAHKH